MMMAEHEVPELDASITGFEEIPLNTTLLLPIDVLTTKISFSID